MDVSPVESANYLWIWLWDSLCIATNGDDHVPKGEVYSGPYPIERVANLTLADGLNTYSIDLVSFFRPSPRRFHAICKDRLSRRKLGMSRMVCVWSGCAPGSEVYAMPRTGQGFYSGLKIPFPHQQIVGVKCRDNKDWNSSLFQRICEGCDNPDVGKIQSPFYRHGPPPPTAGHSGRDASLRTNDRQLTTGPRNGIERRDFGPLRDRFRRPKPTDTEHLRK